MSFAGAALHRIPNRADYGAHHTGRALGARTAALRLRGLPSSTQRRRFSPEMAVNISLDTIGRFADAADERARSAP